MTAAEKAYGGALYALAADEHLEDEMLAGITMVKDLLAQNPGYAKLLENPAVQKAERLSMLDEALRQGVHPYVLNFCKILCEKSALSALAGCEAEYRIKLYAARGILPVTVTSAVALSDTQASALKEKIEQQTGKTVLLEKRLDPAVLGGVKLSYAGKELDGTAAGHLAALKTALMA